MDGWPIDRRRFLGLLGATAAGAAWPNPATEEPSLPGDGRRDRRLTARRSPPRGRFDIGVADDLVALPPQHQAALSPDGRFHAYAAVRSGDYWFMPGTEQPEFATGAPGLWSAGTRLWVTDIHTGRSRVITGSDGRAWSPRWSPDGRFLAFLADHGGAVQVWLWDADVDGAPRRLSRAVVRGGLFGVDTPQWSPDGCRLYVRLTPDVPAPRSGLDGDGFRRPAVDILTSPAGAPDGAAGRLSPYRSGWWRCDLGVIDVASGRIRRLTSGAPAFRGTLSPDGGRLAVTSVATPSAVGRFETERHDLAVMPSAGGSATPVADGVSGFDAVPAWSPDSTRLAYVKDGRAFVCDLTTGRSAPLPAGTTVAAGLSTSAPPLRWHPDGGVILARGGDGRLWRLDPTGRVPGVALPTEPSAELVGPDDRATFTPGPGRGHSCIVVERRAGDDGARSSVSLVPLDGGPPTVVFAAPGSLSFTAVGGISADGTTLVYGVEDDDHPLDLWATDIPTGRPRQLTRFNPAVEPLPLGRSRRVPFTSGRGDRLGSRLLVPPEGTAPFPTVVCVYPSAATLSQRVGQWSTLDMGIVHAQILAGRGYAVLLPDWPTGRPGFLPSPDDVATILDPAVDAVVAAGYVDPDRLAVIGQSNGGTAVNQIVTATDRFRAAVAADGEADLLSGFGQLRITPHGTPWSVFTGAMVASRGQPPWGGDGLVVDSPVRRLDHVRTPLLLIHGRDDSVIGFEQAGEMFVGLSYLGREVTLVAYRGESHVPSRFREANRVHMTDTVLGFLDRHLGQAS